MRVPLAIRRQPGCKTVVTPIGAAANAATPMRADPALLKALARAHRYQRLLAAAERIESGYVGQLLRLTLLAPDIVEALLNGRQLPELELSQLMAPIPASWMEQRETLRCYRA